MGKRNCYKKCSQNIDRSIRKLSFQDKNDEKTEFLLIILLCLLSYVRLVGICVKNFIRRKQHIFYLNDHIFWVFKINVGFQTL